MKSAIELPTRNDFFETEIADMLQANSLNHHQYGLGLLSETIMYRKGVVNMRNIVDVFEAIVSVDIIDEAKFEQHKKDLIEWVHEFQRQPTLVEPTSDGFNDFRLEANEMPAPLRPRPEVPRKKIKLKACNVLYFNGVQRSLMVDYNEFMETYFNYLTAQKLDIN